MPQAPCLKLRVGSFGNLELCNKDKAEAVGGGGGLVWLD